MRISDWSSDVCSSDLYHAPGASRARADEPIKVIGMRRKIAENMAASKRAIPHFTYVDEMDVTALEAMRADLTTNRGGRPTLTTQIGRASCREKVCHAV